jgi:hypothetical protein
MPRDDWAGARNRALGRRKLATGEFYRVALEPLMKVPKRRRRRRKQTSICSCGSLQTTLTPQTFRDGQQHTRVTCSVCGRFVKWL